MYKDQFGKFCMWIFGLRGLKKCQCLDCPPGQRRLAIVEMAVVELKMAISVGWTVSQFPVSQVTKFPDPMSYS